MNSKLVIILSAYNEELTIEKVILDFHQYLPDASVYVIDDILICLIFLLSIFSIIIFLLVNFSFYIMVNHYSLDIIKIIETSLLEIER